MLRSHTKKWGKLGSKHLLLFDMIKEYFFQLYTYLLIVIGVFDYFLSSVCSMCLCVVLASPRNNRVTGLLLGLPKERTRSFKAAN